jgi:hypothetical protein
MIIAEAGLFNRGLALGAAALGCVGGFIPQTPVKEVPRLHQGRPFESLGMDDCEVLRKKDLGPGRLGPSVVP